MHILALFSLLFCNSEENLQKRLKGYEPYSGAHIPLEKSGVFLCNICDLPLFGFEDQYDVGNGWPNFTYPVAKENVYYEEDFSFGFKQYAVFCRGCDSPLGHVFHDGPPPKGLRYCINATYLKIENKE